MFWRILKAIHKTLTTHKGIILKFRKFTASLAASAKPGLLEEDLVYNFIEQNWQTILRLFDPEELEARAETMDLLESEEEWHEECLAYDYEYSVRMDEEFCATIIELVLPFQDLDLAERRGFLSKFRKS